MKNLEQKDASKYHDTNSLSGQNQYTDIINLGRPLSKRPKMPVENRAAQFSPFAALTSYHEKITEAENSQDYLEQEIIDSQDI